MLDYFPKRTPQGYSVSESHERYAGKIFRVVADLVTFPDGSTALRDVVKHGGAVAVVAIDDQQRVVMLEQYRHSVRDFLWELPAGLRDVDGEPPVDAAKRELIEEAGFGAADWRTLVDVVSAAGFSNERVRIFLATGLSESSDTSFEREAEEADLIVRRIPIDECVRAVMSGRIVNSLAIAGVLATVAHLSDPSSALRSADLPWPA